MTEEVLWDYRTEDAEVAFGWLERLAMAEPGAERKALYYEYLDSEAWKSKRAAALERADNRCQLCNRPKNLRVHHRTYERAGDEDATDLTVLCDPCHAKHHGKDGTPKPKKKAKKPKRKAQGRSSHRPCEICQKRKTTKGICKPCRKKQKALGQPKPATKTGATQKVKQALRLGRRLTQEDLIQATGLTKGQVGGAVGWLNSRKQIKRDGNRWHL